MKTQSDRAAWIYGPDYFCSEPPRPLSHEPFRLILLGPPGAGKSTLAESLQDAIGACPLSTGDLFRAARKLERGSRTPAMESAIRKMEAGDLVPDDLVLDLVRERSGCLHCRGGFILDGFPRTVAQAGALDRLLDAQSVRLDAIISLELPVEIVIERLGGRRTCPSCGANYHITGKRPRREGLCDLCHASLVQRADDQTDVIRARMRAYTEGTSPLIDYYGSRVVHVPAAGTPDEALKQVLGALAARTARPS